MGNGTMTMITNLHSFKKTYARAGYDGPTYTLPMYFFVLLYSVMLGVVPDESIQIDATLHSTIH